MLKVIQMLRRLLRSTTFLSDIRMPSTMELENLDLNFFLIIDGSFSTIPVLCNNPDDGGYPVFIFQEKPLYFTAPKIGRKAKKQVTS